ncbi:MAG: hypothetical protein NTX03_11330 [Bacteroidetes bacterium]|nr:hypothetical protein [Bacteroidota bacterium]
MKKIFLLLSFFLSINAYTQKVFKEHYRNGAVKFDYQVDNKTGAKNGYYKSYLQDGLLYQSGNYMMGKKNGLWTTYDENGTGQVASAMNFRNNLMHGQYKQWCFKDSKRYLCGDYLYKDGNEIKSKTYYSNGKLKGEVDVEKKIQNEWFEDGSPKEGMINGKFYASSEDGDGYRWVNTLIFDSLGNEYSYFFAGYQGELKEIQIKDKEGNTIKRYDYNDLPNCNPEALDHNGKAIKLDSTEFKTALSLYLFGPDPNKKVKNNNCKYKK